MNDIELKRKAVIDAYKFSPKWEMKVLAMSEAQVLAVYLRFKREGKI